MCVDIAGGVYSAPGAAIQLAECATPNAETSRMWSLAKVGDPDSVFNPFRETTPWDLNALQIGLISLVAILSTIFFGTVAMYLRDWLRARKARNELRDSLAMEPSSTFGEEAIRKLRKSPEKITVDRNAKLGSGGGGNVYRGTLDGMDVAVKDIFGGEGMPDRETLRNFRKELGAWIGFSDEHGENLW